MTEESSPKGGPADVAERPLNRRMLWIQAAILLFAVGAAAAALPFAEQLQSNPKAGYGALFLLNLLSGALFMLPTYGWAVIAAFAAAMGKIWGPLLVGTTGQVIGEMLSYVIGVTGSPLFRKARHYERVRAWVQRWGVATVFVLAAIPNPFFDIAGAAAGATGLGWKRFMAASWAGRLLKNLAFALLGAVGADLVRSYLFR